jgi:hypothetical protein
MAERGEFELPVPISEQADYRKMSGFAARRRIVGMARGSNAGSTIARLLGIEIAHQRGRTLDVGR